MAFMRMGRSPRVSLALALLLLLPTAALANEEKPAPGNEPAPGDEGSPPPDDETAGGTKKKTPRGGARGRKPKKEPEPKKEKRTEASVLPGAAFDSNLGFGFGVVGDITRFNPEYTPYKARINAQVFLYLAGRPGGGVRVTFQHHYLRLDLPGLANDRLRIRMVGRYRQQVNVGFYGIGNASPDPRPWEAIDQEAEPEACWSTLDDLPQAIASALGAEVLLMAPFVPVVPGEDPV